MKLKSSGSFSIAWMAFAVGLFLSTSAEAFQQRTTASVVPTPDNAPVYPSETVPSPLSGLDAKLEPPEYYSSVIPADQLITYEVDLHETLRAYSVENKCSINDAFLKLVNQLGMSPLATLDQQSGAEASPKQNAFYKLVGNDVYAISAKQNFFNNLQFELSNFQYGDKQIVVEVQFLEVPESDVALLQPFMIPGTFETFGSQLPVVESFVGNGTFANQRDAEMNPKGDSAPTDGAKGTFVRATETRTKAYPTFIGHINESGRQQLIQLSKSRSSMSIGPAPRVVMFPGQRATVSDLSLRPFVISVNKVTDGTDSAHEPVIQLLEDGTKLAIQTDLLSGKLKLSGDLAFSQVLGVETFDYPSAQGDSSGVTIQIPEHRIRKVHWSAEVADNQSILIDSVETFEAEVKAKTRFKAAVTKTMRRLVLITPQIIVQKEELADQDETQNLNRDAPRGAVEARPSTNLAPLSP